MGMVPDDPVNEKQELLILWHSQAGAWEREVRRFLKALTGHI
jgi:hypothetical protein